MVKCTCVRNGADIFTIVVVDPECPALGIHHKMGELR